MQLNRALEKKLFALGALRVGETTLDGTDGLTGLVVEEPNALGAQVRVDHIDVVALADCLVGALGLTGTAVDAVAGDVGGHMGREYGEPDAPRQRSFEPSTSLCGPLKSQSFSGLAAYAPDEHEAHGHHEREGDRTEREMLERRKPK